MKENSKKKLRTAIPKEFDSITNAGDFWDANDLGDHWDETVGVAAKTTVSKTPRYISLEKRIASKLLELSKKEHISVETIVNLWIEERFNNISSVR